MAKSTTYVPTEDKLDKGKYSIHFHIAEDIKSFSARVESIPFNSPSSFTLSAYSLNHQIDIVSLMKSSDETKSLTFRGYISPLIPATISSSKFPRVTNLQFMLKQFPPSFALAGFLNANLEHLHIRHESDAELPQLDRNVSLPKLRLLYITYRAQNFFANLQAPSLRTLGLYQPANHRHRMLTSGHNAENLFRRLSQLNFEDWNGSMEDSHAGSATVFGEIVLKTPGLQSVRFTRCYVDGEELTKAMGEVSLGKLEEMTLSQPSGITREQCDKLKEMVPRLNIYV